MNKRPSHAHHQEVIVEVDPPIRRPAHRWAEIIHPQVSLIVVGIPAFFAVVLFLFWSIPHHDETVSLSTFLWRAILGMLTMAVTWIVPMLLIAGAIGLIIKWNIKPAIECYHQVQEAFGLRARNKVLTTQPNYTVIDEPTAPKFYQVSQERTTYNLKGDMAQIQAPTTQIEEQPRLFPARALYESGQLQQAIAAERLILGPGENGRMLGIAHKKFFSTISSGIPSSGKTTSGYWITVQLILLGARIILIDPHMNYESEDGEQSLTQELEPFRASFVFPPIDDSSPAAIMQRVKWMKKQILLRQQPGYIARARDALLLIIDEFNSVAELEEIRHELAADLSYIQREGRKYYVHTMILGHRWSQQDIGKVNIRTVASTIMAHKQNDEAQAGLLVGKSNVKKVLALSPGQYLFKSINPTTDDQGEKIYDLTRIQTPMISAADADWVLALQRQIATSGGTSRPTTGPLPSHFQMDALPINGSDLHQPGKPLEVESDPDLSPALLSKMYQVIEMDEEGEHSQSEIIAQVWGPEYTQGRKFGEAQAELKRIRKVMAGQLRKQRGA